MGIGRAELRLLGPGAIKTSRDWLNFFSVMRHTIKYVNLQKLENNNSQINKIKRQTAKRYLKINFLARFLII